MCRRLRTLLLDVLPETIDRFENSVDEIDIYIQETDVILGVSRQPSLVHQQPLREPHAFIITTAGYTR